MSKKNSEKINNQSGFFTSSIFIYVSMLCVGLLSSHFINGNLKSSLTIYAEDPISNLIFLGILCGAVLSITSYLFELEFLEYRVLKDYLLEIIGTTPVYKLVFLSLLSAAGEETLFRMALQVNVGIFATCFLFSLLHLGPKGVPNSWTLMAVIISALLGLVYKYTGSMIPVLIGHFVMNITSMLRLKLRYLKLQKENAAKESEEAIEAEESKL